MSEALYDVKTVEIVVQAKDAISQPPLLGVDILAHCHRLAPLCLLSTVNNIFIFIN